jgi:4,5-DOPA dioxygenase extradiol
VASGSLTHNLYEFRGAASHGADYVREFAAWTAKTLQAGNTALLLDYRQHAPSAERAHPTDEHFLPLLIALGAAGEHYETRVLDSGVSYGVLSMDSYLFSSNHKNGSESIQLSQGMTDHG